jgi:hypothetical protein
MPLVSGAELEANAPVARRVAGHSEELVSELLHPAGVAAAPADRIAGAPLAGEEASDHPTCGWAAAGSLGADVEHAGPEDLLLGEDRLITLMPAREAVVAAIRGGGGAGAQREKDEGGDDGG